MIKQRQSVEFAPERVATVSGLFEWLAKNVGTEALQKNGHKNVLEAALWFCAYQDARSLAEETTRHLAQAMVAGIGPYKTRKHLDNFLDAYRGEDEWRDLLELLEEFWKDGEQS